MRRIASPLAAALLAAGCAGKLVRPSRIELCRAGRCEAVNDESSRGRLLSTMHKLLRRAEEGRVEFRSADPRTRAEKGRGVSFFVQGGPIPGRSTVSHLNIEDVLYLDREKGEARARAKASVTYLAVPLLCTSGELVFSASLDEARMGYSNICTWLGAGTTKTTFEFLIDRVDADAATFSGPWSAKTAGLPVIGGGSGYMVAHFTQRAEPAPIPAPPVPIPATTPVAPPAPAPAPPPAVETVEVLSEAPALSFSTKLSDDGGDLVLDGGEGIRLAVEVRNAGKGRAEAVRISLSGAPALASCLGTGRELGELPPGATRAAELSCSLPDSLPSETASLRVEVAYGPKAILAGAKVLRVATRPKTAPEAVEETLSEASVDDIPPRSKAGGSASNVALLIGLSNYREKAIPKVKYAARDAEVMSRYLRNVAGVPEDNLKVLVDDSATKSDIEAYLEDWLPRRVGPESTVYVYYAGHGAPDDTGKEAFLVPFEGHPDFPTKLFPLKRVYAALAKLPARAVVVMLDSCFSGAEGRGVRREGARPLAQVMRSEGLGPVSVLAGASGSQVTSDYDKAKHGLFTYFLLQGLRGDADADHDGAVTLAELFPFVRDGVSRRASTELNRDQTPAYLGPRASPPALPVARR